METREILTEPHFDTLDLSSVVYPDHADYTRLLLKKLKRLKLYKNGLIYTGITTTDPETIKQLGAEDSTRKSVHGYSEGNLKSRLAEDESIESLWFYAGASEQAEPGEVSMVLVYDGSQMTEDVVEGYANVYLFNTGVVPKDALIAAFKIKWDNFQ